MNILILGGGGREHAMAWAFRDNPKCRRLLVAPGNAGIAEIAECRALDILDPDAVVAFVRAEAIDFTVIGPEAPLVAGVADALRAAGALVLGPSAAAAQLEASKAFTRALCDAAGVPGAAWARFDALSPALAHVRAQGAPIVVKADGLAAGKGVTVAATLPEAEAALEALFAQPGAEVVIEEVLAGEEASFFLLCDGETALPIGTAQDHKRVHDGDRGPNTGGMGAFSPSPLMDADTTARALDEIVRPTLAEMTRRGTPFQGILYAGLMIEAGRPRLVEYNVRLGDPEAQVLMMRLGAQVLDLMLACAEGRLGEIAPHWAEDHALTVVMAARGYPGLPETGTPIAGLEALAADSRHQVFHAGTTRDSTGQLVAAGGRVLCVTARAASLRGARAAAYRMVARIDWPGGFCRTDIGARAAGEDG
ncbi:MAG: phosphoribosylamine--glycine ligase [Rhodobacteraceae bacterium]|nr:phosphoribosylamine--glycine ligase [Paracoccaceae bacterium]